jgi:predicted flap endonuclease-1-like 5' DNA nuclease
MAYSIRNLADVPAAAASRLQDLGVTTTQQLLERTRDAASRNALAAQIGASAQQVLAWANEADLLRIPDLTASTTQLLEAAGVESLAELASRNADLLAARVAEVNEELQLTDRVPSAGQVAAWIEQAKALTPAVRQPESPPR